MNPGTSFPASALSRRNVLPGDAVRLALHARRSAEAAISELPKIEDLPTVDVFVPSYNEDAELLAVTLAAAKAMAYPKNKPDRLSARRRRHRRQAQRPRSAQGAGRHSYANEQLKALCDAMGVIYHARKENSHAKAGNLNEGLKISKGEWWWCFDADHAPVRDFLKEDGRLLPRDGKAVPRPDARITFSSRFRSKEPADLRPHAVGERDVLFDHARGWTNGIRPSSAARPRFSRARRWRPPTASPASRSPRIARRRSPCIPRAGTRSMSTSR